MTVDSYERMYARMLRDRLVLTVYRFWQVVATHISDKHLRAVTGT